jgi:hypothetical protein
VTKSVLLAGAALIGLVGTVPRVSASDDDLVIRNGRVLDGAGNPWVCGADSIPGDAAFDRLLAACVA